LAEIRKNRKVTGKKTILLPNNSESNYYFGRLIWSKLIDFHDLQSWKYSVEDIIRLHSILDLQEHIESELMYDG